MFVMIIAALLYICLPWYVQSVVWLANLFIPDPIPFFDELIMFVPIVYKIIKLSDVLEFLSEYGVILAVLLGIGIVALIICILVL